MMASFRAKSARGKRSGDGREAGGRRSRLERAASIPPGRSTGEGMQAVAWSATSFEKLNKAKDANNDSSSTSPETDPGTSSVFPFFTAGEDDRGQGGEGLGGHDGASVDFSSTASGEGRRLGIGMGLGLGLGKPSDKRAAAAAAKARPQASAATAKLEHRNPMFHSANVNAESAVARLFPGEEREESDRAAINGSNPMFKRRIDDNGRPRPKVKGPDTGVDAQGGGGSGGGGDGAAKETKDSGKDNKDKGKGKDKDKDGQPKKKKKEKAMYEHVGRMNVRPFLGGEEGAENGNGHGGGGHGGFRVDTFARNEGEAGGKAHFKFVFTLDGVTVPSEGENAKKLRPVLDAIHERSTGNLRVRVNDGREMTATGTSVVDVAITHIGVVLFNPKTVSKGHHLYTLSLNGRTLFSVLA